MNKTFPLTISDIKVGQKWLSSDGSGHNVVIKDIKCWDKDHPDSLISYDIFYEYDDGSVYDKDAWNFQVRFYLS